MPWQPAVIVQSIKSPKGPLSLLLVASTWNAVLGSNVVCTREVVEGQSHQTGSTLQNANTTALRCSKRVTVKRKCRTPTAALSPGGRALIMK